jgi:hypothetical protein
LPFAECIIPLLWIFFLLHRIHYSRHNNIPTSSPDTLFRPTGIFKSTADLQDTAMEYFFCLARCREHGLKNILILLPNTKQWCPTNIPTVWCISAGCIHLPENIPPAQPLPLPYLNISSGVRCAKGIAGYTASGNASLSVLSD